MKKIQIAIQKNGRLSEQSLALLSECGIKFTNNGRKLVSESPNFPIKILFLRDDDIPQSVEQGVADIGIVGLNEVLEKNKKVDTIKKLGFSTCKLSLAIPKEDNFCDLSYFNDKRIATTYPKILNDFCIENNLNVKIEEISGSVEIATNIGLADAIFDIVSTGSTLLMNGLKEVYPVLKSEAVLIANQNIDAAAQAILDKLLFRINAVNNAQIHKYILLNAPNDTLDAICNLLPGVKSPTIIPLALSNWSSVHSVVLEEEFWSIIDQVIALGAEGILVLSIEKMIQ